MKQRISAGGIVFKNNKILLVHHKHSDTNDFWVLPGGGIESSEGIYRAAEREVFEETGLNVRAEKIAYIEEFHDGDKYVCKFWVYCDYKGGKLCLEYREKSETDLIEAAYFTKEEVQKMKVYPSIVKDELWDDRNDGFREVKYLGYRKYDSSRNWQIHVAVDSDFERWISFLAKVQDEFHGLDLVNDPRHRAFIQKNIKRQSAIFVTDSHSKEIIGAMAYSANSRHISWLAVSPQHRRQGIGSAMVHYMFRQFEKDIPIKVKTFTQTDKPGPTAQAFYKSVGFTPGEIEADISGDNAGNPYHVFWNERRSWR